MRRSQPAEVSEPLNRRDNVINIRGPCRAPRPVVCVAIALLAVALSLACSDDAPAPQTPTPPDIVSTGERLFLLDSGSVFELVGEERRLVAGRPESGFIYDIAVSPDTRRVALAIHGEPRQTETGYDFGIDLYVTQDDGSLKPLAVHEHTGEVMTRPVWLPDGEALLFSALGRNERGGADIRIERVQIATGERNRLIENAMEPALAPDGRTLAYVKFDEHTGFERLMLHDLETGESSPLLAGQLMYNVANLAWSPDGERIAFAAADPPVVTAAAFGAAGGLLHPELRDIWLINADGSGLTRLLELADSTLSLAWAGDSRHLYAVGDTGFWRVDTGDGRFQRLGNAILGGRVQTLITGDQAGEEPSRN